MGNPKTFFEKWLSEILEHDPRYAFNIVCNYYDECGACPLKLSGLPICDPEIAMVKLESITKGDNEDDN